MNEPRLRRAGLSALCGWFLIASLLGSAAAQENGVAISDVDTSDYPDIVVEFSAPPAFGATELTAADITLSENGDARDVELTREVAENIQVMLAVDTSGSMTGTPIEQARVAARAFVETLPPDSQVGLISFGDTPVILSEFTTTTPVLEAIDGIAVDSAAETTVYDAVRLAAQQFAPDATGPRYIVVVTDGGDTASEATLGTAQAAVQAAGIPVFAVSLVTSESDPEALALLTAETGGGVVEATDPVGLADVTNEIAAAISAQYRISYESAANGRTLVEIVASSNDGLTATGAIRVDMPLALQPAPTASPAPTAEPTPTPTPRPAVAIPTVTIDDSSAGWLLPVGIAFVSLALLVLFNYLLWPTRRRRNPLRDMKPVAGRASTALKNSGGVLAGLAGTLVAAAERLVARRDDERLLAQKLDRAGVRMRPAEYVVLVLLAVVLAGLVGLVFSRAAAFLLILLTAVLAWLVLSILGERRAAAFENQLATTLQMMSGALRAGFSISQVVDLVSRESSAPTRDEFARLGVEENLGRDISDSFRDVAQRMQSEDFEWVAEAIDINRTIGGDLSEVLENVSQTIRTRQSIQREIKTLAAEGKLSAIILVAVPFVIAIGQFFVNPDLSSELTGTSDGRVLIAIGLVMISVGAYWMRRIVRLKY